MVAVALAVWIVATVVLAVPAALLLRKLDAGEPEEVIDPVELDEAMRRHPSRRPKVA
jgi:hypothetical protein